MNYEYYDRTKAKVPTAQRFARNTGFTLAYIIMKIVDCALTLLLGSVLLFIWVWKNRKKWIGWVYVKIKKPKKIKYDEREIFK